MTAKIQDKFLSEIAECDAKIETLNKEIREKTLLKEYYEKKKWHTELLLNNKKAEIEIEPISDIRYRVNGKPIYRDPDGVWINPTYNITPAEKTAFLNHLSIEGKL